MSKRSRDLYVGIPVDLEDAEAIDGLERSRKKTTRRKATPQRRCDICVGCMKWGYSSEGLARKFIGKMLKAGRVQGPAAFTFTPYQCRWGWWHIGHDHATGNLIQAALGLEALSWMHRKPSASIQRRLAEYIAEHNPGMIVAPQTERIAEG